MTRGEAMALRDRISALIAEAKENDSEDWGAVNWADICVVDVIHEKSLLDPEIEQIVVLIEEADPSCYLARWLTETINQPNTDVRAEW